MIKNKKLAAVIGFASVSALALASLAGAQTAPLAATCSGAVSQNVITWTASATGGLPPYSYLWSGTNVNGTSSVVTATYSATGTYQASARVGDTTTSTVSATCSAAVTSLPQTTSMPPVSNPPSFFKNPELNINPSGRFLTHGMKVVSVNAAGNSFVGTVWGTTWTVNLSGSPEFFLREGKFAGNVSLSQLQMGDEVGVSGKVDPNNPGVVSAEVVRDYTIFTTRSESETHHNQNKPESGNSGDHKGNRREPNDNANSIRSQIQQILEQIKELQGKMHGQ